MLTRLLLLPLALLSIASAASAGALPGGRNAISPEVVAESSAIPGRSLDLAIVMHTTPGWHGYWQNPGDAGLPMQVEWALPHGMSAAPLRYPVPTRLLVSGIVNYVFEKDYAPLVRVQVPATAKGVLPIRAQANWLACTDKICVPERGQLALDLPVGDGAPVLRERFDGWRQALPRPLATAAHFASEGDRLKVAIPLPASVAASDPYVFPLESGPIDLAAPQGFARSGDWLVATLKRGSVPAPRIGGVLALGDGSGFSFTAVPGAVPAAESAIGATAILVALFGALAGGVLLNLMPCVFPILAIKALHLARSGGDQRTARREAWGYTLGAIIGTGGLGVLLLIIRAGGTAAGWAFQLQDPRTILLLTLLATAITLNLLGLFRLPVIGGETNPSGSIATGALAAFVATPCAGPFLGAALGTALLLPAAGSVAVFAMLGLGLALPFLAVAYVPALRNRLPRPGPWMARLQHVLAIPMGLTALACLWLLWRQAGPHGLIVALAAVGLLAMLLIGAGRSEGRGRLVIAGALTIAVAGALLVPARSASVTKQANGDVAWSETAVGKATGTRPAFVYFTADWCLSCKVNEASSVDRAEVRAAFAKAGVRVFVGDWTNGDPAITRFIEGRGRAGVPLYLWYEPGKMPEELPQVLTPGMLIGRATRAR